MIVVSDTTPLNYLLLIESAHVLPSLFGRVYAPSAVLKELSHPRSPDAVRAWASNPPPWLTVQDPAQIGPSNLGLGEAAAISLALELKAERVLIDIEQKTNMLKQTNFRASDKLYQAVLERVKEQMIKEPAGPEQEGPEEPET